MTVRVDRRSVLAGISVLLGGCASQGGIPFGSGFGNPAAYGPINDNGHEIPGLDMSRIDPGVLRRQVAFSSPYRPGTIVVMIGERHLYFVEPGGRAMRYTVGVGREEALNFRGNAVIGRKAEWPHWTPTADMIHRMPIYAHYTAGLPGGNQDTYFRLHGTIEPETIGQKVSSGCIRLFNHDIIDLYNRAPVGTQVIVIQEGESMRAEAGPEMNGYYEPGAEPIGPYWGPPGPYAGAPGPYAGPYYGPPPWASEY
jgi:lipoprotein-anchoring transpeptidase ErfK/SrfK